jgi:very-short-patch-repair endonuclease
MLKEHFRCVPSIIGYSNRLSYDYKIKPLRDDSQVLIKPATIAYRVDGERHGRKKTNEVEAQTIVALMMACMEHKEYENMTFGVITLLGDEQAKKINELAIENIMPDEYDKRRILCGNASNFQGDERDVIFLTLVDSNEGEGPLRMAGEGIGKSTKQRYNVAVSRAKDQIWVVHSLDVANDLKSGDMRRDLIEYATDPNAFQEQLKVIKLKADSPFEVSVAKALVKNGYKIVQQWPVGSYRIDMVAVCQDKKIAIECDGELYHSGDEKIREDMERQAVLERLGWRFVRIRGSEYYGDPEVTMRRVMRELTEYEIEPEESLRIDETSGSELQQSVIAAAGRILLEWEKEKLVDCEMENAQNFDRPHLSEWHEIANENVVSGLLH